MYGLQPFFDPFDEMRRMQRDLDRLNLGSPFQQRSFGGGRPTFTGPPLETFGEETQPVWTPRCDVRDSNDFIVVYAELPGLSPQDIKLELEEDNFRISGERKPLTEADEGITWQTMERRFGPFERNIRVPRGVNAQESKATFENGILRVQIPKPPRFGAIQIMEHEKVKGKEKLREHEEGKERLGEPTREVPTGEQPLREKPTEETQPRETPEVGKTGGIGEERLREGEQPKQEGGFVEEPRQGETREGGTFEKSGQKVASETKEETNKFTTQKAEETPTERFDTQPTTGANV